MAEGESSQPPKGFIDQAASWLKRIRNPATLADKELLSKEDLLKTDRDISTFAALGSLAKSKGRVMSISGGYAVEAHCGGKVTRPHGDMDCQYYLEKGFNQNEVTEELKQLLSTEKHTQWLLHSSDQSKIEFREDAPRKPWNARRRVEILLYTHSPKNRTQTRTLVNSAGEPFELEVDDISNLVAHKISILNNRQNTAKEELAPNKRLSKPTDTIDIKRLISQPHFNEAECLERFGGYLIYKSGNTLPHNEAINIAQTEWNRALEIINS